VEVTDELTDFVNLNFGHGKNAGQRCGRLGGVREGIHHIIMKELL
jgi:hypothetical protein